MSDKTEPPSTPDIRVGFILSPRFTMLPLSGFLDVLRHAADEADRSRQIYCAWDIIGPTREPVISSSGIEIVPQELLGDPTRFDCIVIVGGLLPWSRRHPPETFGFLRRAAEADLLVAGLCTGCFTLAAAGLLDGRRCAVHIRYAAEFEGLFPDIKVAVQQIYLFDHNIVTCPGGTAAIDLAIEIVSRYSGRARATKCLVDLFLDEHRSEHHVPSHPFQDLENCGDERVEEAVRIMRRDLSEKRTVKAVAGMLGLSVGQLKHAFQAHTAYSPAEVWRLMRLQHARWRVLNTVMRLTDIAHECGFSDSSHFTRWFRRVYGQTPGEARKAHLSVREYGEGLRGDTRRSSGGGPGHGSG